MEKLSDNKVLVSYDRLEKVVGAVECALCPIKDKCVLSTDLGCHGQLFAYLKEG